MTPDAILLAGLTANADETPGASVLFDACEELEALVELVAVEPRGEPVDRRTLLVLLDGITRRMHAGVQLLRRERGRADPEVTSDAAPSDQGTP